MSSYVKNQLLLIFSFHFKNIMWFQVKNWVLTVQLDLLSVQTRKMTVICEHGEILCVFVWNCIKTYMTHGVVLYSVYAHFCRLVNYMYCTHYTQIVLMIRIPCWYHCVHRKSCVKGGCQKFMIKPNSETSFLTLVPLGWRFLLLSGVGMGVVRKMFDGGVPSVSILD